MSFCLMHSGAMELTLPRSAARGPAVSKSYINNAGINLWPRRVPVAEHTFGGCKRQPPLIWCPTHWFDMTYDTMRTEWALCRKEWKTETQTQHWLQDSADKTRHASESQTKACRTARFITLTCLGGMSRSWWWRASGPGAWCARPGRHPFPGRRQPSTLPQVRGPAPVPG